MDQEQYERDFKFTEEMKPVTIEGRRFLEVRGQLINIEAVMDEITFRDHWMFQFLIGYCGEKKFFNENAWKDLTNDGKSGMLIHEAGNPSKPLFVVPPLSDMNFSPEEAGNIQAISQFMSGAKSAVDDHQASKILREGKNYIDQATKKVDRRLADLVPLWFTEKYGVDRELVVRMTYCRVRYGLQPNTEAWTYAEECFKTILAGNAPDKHQIEFLDVLTQGEYQLPEGLKKQSTKQLPPSSISPNLDEC